MAAPPSQPQRTIRCYMCGHRFDVSARTMSTSCPKCFNPLKVEDIIIKGPHSVRKIQTCGRILVEPKALLIAPVIQTGEGIEVQGTLEGNVTTHGPVHIGAKASWKGDCKAPSLTVELGAVIHKGFFAISREPPAQRESGVQNAHPPPAAPQPRPHSPHAPVSTPAPAMRAAGASSVRASTRLPPT